MAKKKWPKPSIEFPVPIYGGTAYLYRTQSEFEDALAFIGANTAQSKANGKCQHLTNNVTGESIYMVGWFNSQKSTLVHECAHMAFFILAHAGIDARESAGEAFCYLQDWLFTKFGGDVPENAAIK